MALSDRSPKWDQALCADRRDDAFFTEGEADTHHKTAAAIRLCKTPCPILDECFEFAMHNRLWGIWGGTTGRQRALLRKQRRTAC